MQKNSRRLPDKKPSRMAPDPRREDAKKIWWGRLQSALMTGPALAVLLLTALINLMAGVAGLEVASPSAVFAGVLAFLALLASTVLATLYRRRFPPALFSLLFALCFLCYLLFCLNGRTDLFEDPHFERLMLALSLPIWAFMPLALCVSSAAAAPVLVLTGLLLLLNVGSLVYLSVSERREAVAEAGRMQSGRKEKSSGKGSSGAGGAK